jgi:hypothetical protein
MSDERWTTDENDGRSQKAKGKGQKAKGKMEVTTKNTKKNDER